MACGSSAAIAALRFQAGSASPSRSLVFLGTRSRAKGQGTYSCFFDSGKGTCSSVSLASDLELPTWLAVSADARYLYSVSEVATMVKRREHRRLCYRPAYREVSIC